MQEDSLGSQSDNVTPTDESFCLQVKIQCIQASSKIPTTYHLFTNVAYKLKPFNTDNIGTWEPD